MGTERWFERLWLFVRPIARVVTTAAGVIIAPATTAVLSIVPVITGIPIPVAALAIAALPGTVIPATVIIAAIIVAFRTMVLFSYNIQNLEDLLQYATINCGDRRRGDCVWNGRG